MISAAPQLRCPDTFAAILANARALFPFLRAEAPACEAERRLTEPVVDALRRAGMFRLTMPRAWGGPELTSLQQIEVIEEISRADASAGWCVMIGCDSGLYSGFVEERAARALWPRLDMVQAGWIHPVGRAEIVEGGVQVSGRWAFCSGSTHADVVAAGCLLYRDGKPVVINGRKQWRLVVAPRTSWTFEDTWHTSGLRGTASRDYTTSGSSLFVPGEYCFTFEEPRRHGTLWARPDTLLRKMAGIPLGVAMQAIDDVVELVEGKVERPSGIRYRDLERVRTALADARMTLGSARSYVQVAIERQWSKIERGESLTRAERADVWLSRLNAFQAARVVVRTLFDAVGGGAIYARTSPLERPLRDLETMCQHIAGQRKELANIGGLLLADERVDQNILLPA
jgi:alkylation response protein AidB-like acyl-CoA dehydrogenase